MPSFDIVSKVDFAEFDNALAQAQKEIGGRYDLKNAKVSYDKLPDNAVQMKGATTENLDTLRETLMAKMAKRGISLRHLEYGKEEPSGSQLMKQKITLKQGISPEKAKKIVALIKDSKMKVQASIQGEDVRVTGKNRDDLQEAMALLRTKTEQLEVDLQFTNFRD